MKIAELRKKNPAELSSYLLECKKALMALRFAVAAKEVVKTHLFKVNKKNIARLKTVLAENVVKG
jgi:ribosomal protein L29